MRPRGHVFIQESVQTQLGLFCWAGFVAPVKFVDAMFGKRGQKILLIESGYHLVTFVVMATIIGAWHP